MTLVADLSPRFCNIGISGDEKPSQKLPSYIGYPTSPPNLNFEEVSSIPVDTLIKTDKLDVFPIIYGSQTKIDFDPKTLKTFTSFLDQGQSSLLLSSPAVADHNFMSSVAELIFNGSTGYAQFLPQDSAVTSAFGCGRVSSMVLEIFGCGASISAIEEGSVCARGVTTKDSCDDALRAYIKEIDLAPPFPYSPKKNPFVSESFLDLSRVNSVYEKPEIILPDGCQILPALPKLINETLKQDTVTADVACTIITCGEALEVISRGGFSRLRLSESLHEIGCSDANFGWRVIRGGSECLSSWFGGSILGSLSVYGSVAVDSVMWAEHGRSLWARKGF